MINLSTNQKIAAFELLTANGWQFIPDSYHPTSYANGWFVNPNHSQKSRPTGDSKQMYHAAESTIANWTEYTVDDLPKLDTYRNVWVWPDGSES